MRRGVGKTHPARRVERWFGYGALAGVGLLLLCIPLGIVLNLTDAAPGSPLFLAPLLLGSVLAGFGWIMWGSWSATLDRYSEPLSGTAKLTLAATTAIVVSVLCVMGAGAPLVLYTDTDPPDSLFPVIIGLGGFGVLLFVGTLVGAAVGGAIALGGRRWWWVGALLSAGLLSIGFGVTFEWPLLTVASAAALVVACFGYRGALRAGLAEKRPDAVEADGYRKRTGR